MSTDEKTRELASGLAKGDLTISESYVLQSKPLQQFLDELPPKSPLPDIHAY